MGIPYCQPYINKLVAQGKFPAPVRLSEHRVAFLKAEIDAWIASRERVGRQGDEAA
jgi:predicted DNA-binding transcriptional regulator AlpA